MILPDHSPAVPRPAAALILVDDSVPPKVLLARRNESLAFMGGQYCFPGGRIHRNENVSNVFHTVNESRARAVHAAVRETFEETGLLCVEGEIPPPQVVREARLATIADPERFDPFLETHGLWIDAGKFEFAGLWVTPPISPIRFRTRYFLYRFRYAKSEELIDGEMTDLQWVHPREARRRWRNGEWDTSTPVGFALGILATEPLERWPHALQQVPNTPAGVPGRFELRWGVHLIPLRTDTLPPAAHANCVVVGEDTQVIIDPGASDPTEQAVLIDQIRTLDTGTTIIRAILLTHSHRDHVGAADMLRRQLGIPIWGHRLTGEQLKMPLDHCLDDGDIIQLGGDPPWRLRCIHTPGHDPGHLCFLEESTGFLIAGDMVANPGSIFVSPKLRGDMTAYLDSLERLKSIPFDRIVPGHGIPLQSGAHDLIQRHIDHRLWREDKIKQALADGFRDIESLLRRVYDDVDESVLILAEGNLRAHLERLGATPP